MQVQDLSTEELLAIIITSDTARTGSTRCTNQLAKQIKRFGSKRVKEEKKNKELNNLIKFLPEGKRDLASVMASFNPQTLTDVLNGLY